jgi:hypothetical protein
MSWECLALHRMVDFNSRLSVEINRIIAFSSIAFMNHPIFSLFWGHCPVHSQMALRRFACAKMRPKKLR